MRRAADEERVLLLHGAAFSPNGEDSQYVRASFSTASEEQMAEALRRFAKVVKEEVRGAAARE